MSALNRSDSDCESGSAKPRRPDRAVYVPRARRTAEGASEENKPPDCNKRVSLTPDAKCPTPDTKCVTPDTKCVTPDTKSSPPDRKSPTQDTKCPKSPALKDKSIHNTPKRSLDKTFCNVYTPPHLRNPRSHTAPSIGNEAAATDTNESVPSGCQVPNSDSAISFSDSSYNELEVGESFYIGDYFANGQLGFYSPSLYDYADVSPDYQVGNSWQPNETDEVNMAGHETQQTDIINNDYLYNKDEDAEKNELKRASQEINRSSKRIIKQSFDSDVLVISDPIEEDAPKDEPETVVEVKELEQKKPKPKLEAKLSLKREENDWDAVFDESGECLDPSLLEELTSTVGKVQITKTKNSYDQYQTRGQALFNGPYDETFGHVVEVYDFPSEFKTNDLLALFSDYKDTGFEIKWVDDTHALIVFSNAKIAAEVLSKQNSLARCRPLHAATLESRNKAKKCAEFLQPYRQRPETCTALARRLVSGALGVRLSTASQERAEERRLISRAREKKRQAALHKEAAWDGSLTNQPLGDA